MKRPVGRAAIRAQVAIEIRAAEIAARNRTDVDPLAGEHFGVTMGWSIHQDWSAGLHRVPGDRDWLTSDHRRVGYLARQIICGDGGRR